MWHDFTKFEQSSQRAQNMVVHINLIQKDKLMPQIISRGTW
jgi:hypothetical protein